MKIGILFAILKEKNKKKTEEEKNTKAHRQVCKRK